MNIALLTAAGIGTRMNQEIPKQFIHVNDKPLIIYTMEAFQKNANIDAIMVVTLPAWINVVEVYAKQFNISKLRWILPGGENGQQSIFNGLSKLKEDCETTDTVLIHDGNRCLVSGDIIADSLATYNRYGSAIAAIPCVEVVFDSKDGISSHKSYNRNNLWRTQTPHTYSLGKLLWAHEQANKKGIKNTAATCELMEILGEDIYFSKGSELNLKITTMDDLEIFKALIANN